MERTTTPPPQLSQPSGPAEGQPPKPASASETAPLAVGYVCNLGESGPPQGLIDGLKQTNWMQDAILEEMQARPHRHLYMITPHPSLYDHTGSI